MYLVQQVLLVYLDQLVQPVHRGKLELLDLLERQVLLDLLVLRVILDQQVQLD